MTQHPLTPTLLPRPAVGPQLTLYLPATLLQPGFNTLILVEEDRAPCLLHTHTCRVEFTDTPQIAGPTPHDTRTP